MQRSQLKEEHASIARRIDSAATACQLSNAVPEELRESLGRLDQESDELRQLLDTAENDNRIIQCVDRLEKLGDRAMHACSQDSNVDPEVEKQVREAHDAISALKHRLH
jgi:hypothetical protein